MSGLHGENGLADPLVLSGGDLFEERFAKDLRHGVESRLRMKRVGG
jgi:hypothetical protein